MCLKFIADACVGNFKSREKGGKNTAIITQQTGTCEPPTSSNKHFINIEHRKPPHPFPQHSQQSTSRNLIVLRTIFSSYKSLRLRNPLTKPSTQHGPDPNRPHWQPFPLLDSSFPASPPSSCFGFWLETWVWQLVRVCDSGEFRADGFGDANDARIGDFIIVIVMFIAP